MCFMLVQREPYFSVSKHGGGECYGRLLSIPHCPLPIARCAADDICDEAAFAYAAAVICLTGCVTDVAVLKAEQTYWSIGETSDFIVSQRNADTVFINNFNSDMNHFVVAGECALVCCCTQGEGSAAG